MEKQALISVFDKTGVVKFAQTVQDLGISIISTGGTFKTLQDNGLKLKQVSDVTHFPEILEGRVKTLHPHIHGGLLAKLENPAHVQELEKHKITPISIVVVNLYAFEETVAKPVKLDDAIEMIDIGGVTLMRAAAKNYKNVLIITDPKDYEWIAEKIKAGGLEAVTLEERKKLAVKAFRMVAHYDSAISNWLESVDVEGGKTEVPASKLDKELSRGYTHQMDLKYGCNPHQNPAAIYSLKGMNLPFKILNGTPGYINLLDALNGYQLVKELQIATNLPAATSFKHVSPAGAAVAVPLNADEAEVMEVTAQQLTTLTPVATAFLRARHADPMCSFGDFVAISDEVDECTANLIKVEVSDGIIAPAFSPKAVEILKQKKNGAYIILQADKNFHPGNMEIREVFGAVFVQKRNDAVISKDLVLKQVVTKSKDLPEDAVRDLIVANICMKYTQSNSVGYAYRGQMIGVGAGQQSRVDCAKLAGRKVQMYFTRFHPKVRQLAFKKEGVKRVDRINARVHFIEQSLTKDEIQLFEGAQEPVALTQAEKDEWLKKLSGVSVASDAFFPFRDSIDVAAKYGVKYVVQPGGSVQDEGVVKACDEYGMAMTFTGVRLFHH